MMAEGISRPAFRAWFTLATFFSVGIFPTMFYAVTIGQWGSNLIWGSVYGVGWCLASNFYHALDLQWVMAIGVLWAILMVPMLYWFSGWLWETLDVTGRKRALCLLLVSLCIMVPGEEMLRISNVLHVPDLQTHFATGY